MNNDHPENGLSTGDWETINSFGERSVCGNPTGVQAYPIDKNAGSTAVTHIGRFKILQKNKFFLVIIVVFAVIIFAVIINQ